MKTLVGIVIIELGQLLHPSQTTDHTSAGPDPKAEALAKKVEEKLQRYRRTSNASQNEAVKKKLHRLLWQASKEVTQRAISFAQVPQVSPSAKDVGDGGGSTAQGSALSFVRSSSSNKRPMSAPAQWVCLLITKRKS